MFGEILKKLKVNFPSYFYLEILIKLEIFKNVKPSTEAEFQSWRSFLEAKGFSVEEMRDLQLTSASLCGTYRESMGNVTRSLIAVAVGAVLGLYTGALIAASG